jgi:hypothetical protein
LFTLTRPRLLFAVTVAVAFASLLALAAFSTIVSAHQNDDADGEHTHAAGEQEADEATTEEEPITIQNHAWGNYHWGRTDDTLSLNLGDNVSSKWDKWLTMASNDWSTPSDPAWSDVLDTTVVPGSVSSRALKNKKCTPTRGRVEVCNAAYGKNGWLGIAQIWIDADDHITAGTAKLNDSYYSMSKYNTNFWRSHVMCQEVGHTFGLAHQDETGKDLHTCMDYARNPDADNMHPNEHDYEQLAIIYPPHTDSTATSQMPAMAERGNYDTPAEWGKLKQKTRDGHNKTYEREFSDGAKLVTFVEMVEPEDQPQQEKKEKKQDTTK